MTLEQAVAVLNRVGHQNEEWAVKRYAGKPVVALAGYCDDTTPRYEPFEAIALATYYESTGLEQWPGWDWAPGASE